MSARLKRALVQSLRVPIGRPALRELVQARWRLRCHVQPERSG
jgi:hypothetical protein